MVAVVAAVISVLLIEGTLGGVDRSPGCLRKKRLRRRRDDRLGPLGEPAAPLVDAFEGAALDVLDEAADPLQLGLAEDLEVLGLDGEEPRQARRRHLCMDRA
jgi:hypothetical protein